MSPAAVQNLLLASCVALLAVCVLAPYVLRVPPRTAIERRFVVAVLTFLIWLLAGFIFLRSA